MFKFKGAPQSEAELGTALDEIRSKVTDADARNEGAIAKITEDVKQVFEAKQIAERAEAEAKNAAEIAKALHRDGRSSDDKIERQLREMPQPHAVEKDQDLHGRVSRGHYNVLAMTNRELRMYLDDDAYKAARRLRKLNDMLLTADMVMRQSDRARDYVDRGGMRSLSFFSAYADQAKVFARALDTATSGNVSEWAPTGYTSERLTDVRDKLQFADQFRWYPMPQNPFKFPVLSTFMTAYRVPEALADATASNTEIPTSDPGSSDFTLYAAKLATLTYWSREIDQDSIVPILPLINTEVDYALAYGWDNATLNGQGVVNNVYTGATNIDAGGGLTTTDSRTCFNGVRSAAETIGKSVDFGGTGMTVENLAAMIGGMGKYADPNQCFYVTGYSGLARALVLKDGNGNAVYLTREKAGSDATLFSGQVGILMGYPLVVTGVYPQNMNASGVVDGVTTTKTGLLLVNKQMFMGGLRQSMQVDVSDHFKFSTDQRAVRSTLRIAFKPVITPSASKPYVVKGVNLGVY